uniref:endonuclease III n=1 Tax=Ndongobacter massiliensis TaxID=1871025 RepID=UPI000930ECED|nr:endonuclease III [Ndongobacter massiliensis]
MSNPLSQDASIAVIEALGVAFPDAHCELAHKNPYELLIATILSAQCTDVRVNQTTRTLFPKYPTPQALAQAPLEEVQEAIREVGLYRTKGKNIRATARILVEQYDGKVPDTREALMNLPGVGRKTANVVLSNAFGVPAIAVDTHVFRVSNRIGLSRSKDVESCERDLRRILPENLWNQAHHRLIFQGRYVCRARKPLCEECAVRASCLFYGGRTISQSEEL